MTLEEESKRLMKVKKKVGELRMRAEECRDFEHTDFGRGYLDALFDFERILEAEVANDD